MSYLEKQKAGFSSSLASASGKLSVKTSAFTPTPAPVKKEPKRKIPVDGDDNINTIILLMTYIHEYLRAQTEPKKAQDIIDNLEKEGHLRNPSLSKCQRIIDVLRHQTVVQFKADPSLTEQKWDSGTYFYLGKLGGIKDKVGLLGHLQAKSSMEPLLYKELKEGWPQCDAALAELKRENKIITVEDKKTIKHIFIDDPTLRHTVEDDFKNMWKRVVVPSNDDIVKKLVAAGQKPASADPNLVKKIDTKKIKKRANRRSAMTTNVHMQHLLKDFSGGKK
ncbi:Transcription initiation factor IIE subunit beta like protein [Verticillium longisporum]|uniref:Transcription initiation factor IIE subunit beta n=5 Tax=Verticillium TaxID=1036719 RepID=G2WSG8_VERDV|nr:transcription initiation factor IIE subunit beta [Verticillium dahliae VdLs.17]XP_028496535.1 Transcription initiation factor IIE subunit beta [Verticillium nonalfalfae]KAF3342797.1 Putative vesicular-fusion protein sec17-like protein [Verticillium dahliae VDG2]KAG7124428.1 Transcription initiation factor IIE subunit beta like protein [Verticillium longisporum]KAH6700854.1 transcription initiation factor IIE subunit beta [Verticillium dahliae]EGY17889.1 transcription initiation factor IIE s